MTIGLFLKNGLMQTIENVTKITYGKGLNLTIFTKDKYYEFDSDSYTAYVIE